MTVPLFLQEKVAARLAALIAEGDSVAATIELCAGEIIHNDWLDRHTTHKNPDYEVMDGVMGIEWMTKCVSLLHQIIPLANPNRKLVEEFGNHQFNTPGGCRYLLAKLRAVHNDFTNGFLTDAWQMIRAEVAADYMAQADGLLGEGLHVPAAVLAGAVLEDALRKLCLANELPIDKPNGERKTINPMNDDLAKKRVYNAAKADEIRAWAKYRNDAAHGDGDRVKADDVRRMLDGVRAFVGEYLR